MAHPLALSAESLRSLVSVPVIAKLRSPASVPALAPDEPQGRRAAHTIDVAPASHTPGHETDQHDAQSGGGGGGSGGAGGAGAGAGAGGGAGGRHGRWSQFFMQLDGLSGPLEFGEGVDDAANLEQVRLRASRIFDMLQVTLQP